MNTKSVICSWIKENPDWETKLEELRINTNREGDLAIFNYGIAADFANPVVQEARGIIIDVSTLDVVCWPFRKFGNYNESYADEIDWSSARVQEKVDGSIIKLYYYNGEWTWATNKMINAKDTRISTSNKSFYDVIVSADYYSLINYDDLNKDYTYIFELVSPETRVVIEYPFTRLFHIGTRNKVTGEELVEDIGIIKPAEYPLTNFEECLDAVSKLNRDGSMDHEGFVVVDANWHRIKIKTSEYFAIHHTINNHVLTKKRCLKYILESPEQAETVKKEFPEVAHIIMYYEYKVVEFKNSVASFLVTARNMFEEYSYDRKAVALALKDNPYMGFGMRAISNPDLTADDLFARMPMSTFESFIPEYTPLKVF